jgi:hypothetical protein
MMKQLAKVGDMYNDKGLSALKLLARAKREKN